jgi:hypothetical protein
MPPTTTELVNNALSTRFDPSGLFASETLLSGRIVCAYNGRAFYFDPSDVSLKGKVIGITRKSARPNEEVFLQSIGKFFLTGFNLIPDTRYWAGPKGQLITDPSLYTLSQSVGYALDSETLLLDFSTSEVPLDLSSGTNGTTVTHNQGVASNHWVITYPVGIVGFPEVIIKDTLGKEVIRTAGL